MVLTDEATRAQAERILQSKVFRTSEVLRHLLAYLIDKSLAGEADSLKEYTIGLDALGKPASFDPRQESVVRMHAARLRQKLGEYYRTEGVDDPIIVDLPKGGFRVTFENRQAAAPIPAPAPFAVFEPEIPARSWRTREIVVGSCLLVALTFAAYFGVRVWQLEQHGGQLTSVEALTPALRELWEPMLSSDRRLVLCVATPLFVRIPGFGLIREGSVNDWDDVSGSKKMNAVEDALQAAIAEPSYGFTGVGTASGAFLLGQFLAPRKQNVLVTRANLLSWPELTEDNVIFLGPMTGIHQTEDIPMDQQLVLEQNGIRNVKPRPGEPSFLGDLPAQAGEEGGISHTLISRVPGMHGHGAILMLSGNQTASVMGGVQAFTNPNLAQMLVNKMKNSSGNIPRYFQVVLKVKSMDDVPVEISYMFHRELAEPQ